MSTPSVVAPTTSDPAPDVDRVAAVVVTYHPDLHVDDRIRQLVGQVTTILIIDNGSSDAELEPVHRLVAEGAAILIANGENQGQAFALNQGLQWAQDRSIPWVLALDQDTSPGPNLVEAAGRVFAAERSRLTAVIGAGWIIPPRRDPDCDDPRGIEVATVVTSGALHSVAAWRLLGGFRADFFIDNVDIEYCLRARAAGFAVMRVCTPTMVHAFGEPTEHRLLHRKVHPSNYSPARRYFNARNRLFVWRTYGRTEPRYVVGDIKGAGKELVKLVVFETGRKRKLAAILLGVRDSLRGRFGPAPRRIRPR